MPCKCTECGVFFMVKPSHTKTRKCCSLECSKKYRAKIMAGERNHQYGRRREQRGKVYKGGRRVSSWGYILVLVGDKYEFEHRVVMENALGRRLSRLECVHHKNHDRTDNRLENLEVMLLPQHTAHHNIDNPMPRDPKTQQFISKTQSS